MYTSQQTFHTHTENSHNPGTQNNNNSKLNTFHDGFYRKRIPRIKLSEKLFQEKIEKKNIHDFLSIKNIEKVRKEKKDKAIKLMALQKSRKLSNDLNNSQNDLILQTEFPNPSISHLISNENRSFAKKGINMIYDKINKKKVQERLENTSTFGSTTTSSFFNNSNKTKTSFFNNSNRASSSVSKIPLKTTSNFSNFSENKSISTYNPKEIKTDDLSILPYLQDYDFTNKFKNLNESYNKLKDNPELLDQDIEILKELYYVYKNTEGLDTHMPDRAKRDIFNRYCIDLSKIPLQEQIVKNYYANLKKKNETMSNAEKNNQDQSYFSSIYFNSIFSALTKVNTNKQIHDSITGLWAQKQIDKYGEIIDKEEELKLKLALMPIIRESKVERQEKKRKYEELNEDDLIGEKGLGINIKALLSRDTILNKELVYKIENTHYYKNRPHARSHCHFINVNNCLYLFGGLNGDRFNDIWKLENPDGKK